MKTDEKMQENNARHAGETHNNKRRAFRAYGFICTGMKILTVTITNVRFTREKVTFLGPKSRWGG